MLRSKNKRRKTAVYWFLAAAMIVSVFGGAAPAIAEQAEAVEAGTGPNGDFYAYVPYTPNAPVTTYAFEQPKAGIVSLEFDVTPLEDSVEGHIAFNTSEYVMGYTNERKVNVMLRPNGTFAANDNGATKSASSISYSKGQTYRVALTIDIAGKKYSATVDGKPLATNYAFRAKKPLDIKNIGVMGVVSLSGGFKVTNISEKLVDLVDNDTTGMDETNNPAVVNGAKVYSVGPTHKYKKVQDVIALLQPGDTVEVAGNATYPAPIFIDSAIAGTKQKPITLKGISINGAKPVLKTLNATNMVEAGADHYVIDNFEIAGNLAEVLARFPGVTYDNIMDQSNSKKNEISDQTVYRGIFHKADGLIIRNCTVHDARMGILGADQGSGSITVEYSDVYRNGTKAGHHNLYLAADEVAHPDSVARVQYNYIHDSNAGNGLKTRAGRNEVYYNWFSDNYYQSLELIGPDPNFDIIEDDEGNEYYAFTTALELREINPAYGDFLRREDSDVVGNVIVHTRGDLVRIGGDGTSDMSLVDEDWELILDDNGNPVKLGPAYGQTYGRYRFVNNTFIHYKDDAGSASEPARAIRIEFGVESVEMYNNVFYKPVGKPMSIVAEYTDTDAINTANWASGARLVKGANNWVQTGSTDVPDAAEWTGTLFGQDPGLIDASAQVRNFGLAPNSPLRGAGIKLDQTVATWSNWTNTLYDFSAGMWPVEQFDFASYTGTPVTMSNIDNAFPNALMSVSNHPVDPVAMTSSPRDQKIRPDIGAFGGERDSDSVSSELIELAAQLNHFIATGDINGPSIKQLGNELSQAEHHAAAGRFQQAAQQLKQFQLHMNKPPQAVNVSDKAKEALNPLIDRILEKLSK